MTAPEAIHANARLVIDQLGPLSELGERFGYNRESVEWVEGFIERQRVRPDVRAADKARMVQVLGSFLGECIVHTYGGEWRERDGSWGVFFDPSNAAFPFSKVGKQFDNGAESGDSILSFFDAVGIVILKRPGQPPV
ncbi:MAG TPA: hypothetical protein VKE93_01935 [Candidatus Angelobacter sp.]|nr:hypothetical protein [Candidatus Angelobacter sp.]